MVEDCCATNGNIMILACSGGSNVGQLSNQAAVDLTREGFGKMYCLAGVGGLLSGFVQSAKDTPRMVAIDGCSIGCSKEILENADVPLKGYIVVTDLGIEKNHDFALNDGDTRKVKEAIRKTCVEHKNLQVSFGSGSECCCG